MRIDVHTSDDLRVAATVRGHRIETDQPEKAGGGDTAPAPFELFLASIATCAGFYAQRFCGSRGLDPEAVAIALITERDPETRKLSRLRLEVELPEDFPEKYRIPLVRAIDQCAVKKAILDPPAIDVEVLEPAGVGA